MHRNGQSLRAALDVRPYGEPDTDWYVETTTRLMRAMSWSGLSATENFRL